MTWATLRKHSYIKVTMLPVIQRLVGLCIPNTHGLRIELTDNMLVFTTSSHLYVACERPLLLTNGTSYITLQMNVNTVRLNRFNLPETVWVRIFSYYMPKRITLGASVLHVQLEKISKRTMQFRLRGDVTKWTGKEPVNAYVRFTSSTLELFSFPGNPACRSNATS